MTDLRNHIGRTRTACDIVTRSTLTRLAVTLGWEAPDHQVPPLWHWLFATPVVSKVDLGEDGHERLGLFMPDIPDALRMWAAGDVQFEAPIFVGDCVEARSTITRIVEKERPGERLWFVDVLHEYHVRQTVAVREVQTIVYRVRPSPLMVKDAKPIIGIRRHPEILSATFSDLDLFRYSALTFNSHRIHLDRAFCRQNMGDARLVVHGPLLATLAARAAEIVLEADLASFSFKARRPVREQERISIIPVSVAERECQLQIVGEDGGIRLEATARTK
jgi:3-methylfumaryl-CoA hydratase